MFNSIRVSLDGKIAAVRESMKLQTKSLERNISPTQAQNDRADARGLAHQKRRKLHILN